MDNPGSDAAIKLGCTCPVMDNAHGRRADGLFWINGDCPVHGEMSFCCMCGRELAAVRPGRWQCNHCEKAALDAAGE